MTLSLFRKHSVALLCLSLLPVAACRRPAAGEADISVRHQLAPLPTRVGPATLTIQLADAAQKPIAHATLEVEADMSHPGMAPVFGDVEETTPGSFRAHLSFTMAGDWVVLLHIKLPDGRKMVRQVDVRGVQPN